MKQYRRTLFAFMLLGLASQAFALVDCESPLHQRMYETMPLFRAGYNEKDVMTMFRGVKPYQFSEDSMLHYLFHDPYVYSSGLMIENGSNSGPTAGTWKYSPPQEGKYDTIEAEFMKRWEQMLEVTYSNVDKAVKMDGKRPVWKQRSYDGYNSDSFYNWVQFASTAFSTASGYAGGYWVLNMTIPTARVNPNKRNSDEAYVIPVLIAPWEVTSVTYQASGNSIFKKIFNQDSGEENACIIDSLALTNSSNEVQAYLQLCPEDEYCDSNINLLNNKLNAVTIQAIQKFKMNGQVIAVTQEKPISKGGPCSANNIYTDVSQLQSAIEKLNDQARYVRLKRAIGLLYRSPEIKCSDGIKNNIELWANLPSLPWNHLLIIGLGTQNGGKVAKAIDECVTTETPDDTCADRLENFAMMDTTLTRKAFIKDLLRVISEAPADQQSASAIKKLNEYLVAI